MTQPQHAEVQTWTADDYLAMERDAIERSEFVDGEIFAMAGASEQHNLITSNVIGELHHQLKKRPCKVYANDMRVQINAADKNYVYPDVVALCETAAFAESDNLTNPALVVEVLSDSTERYDRGYKFELYRCLPTMQEYVLIAQNRYHVEHYQRQADNTWLFREYRIVEDSVELPSIGCQLHLEDIYAKVAF